MGDSTCNGARRNESRLSALSSGHTGHGLRRSEAFLRGCLACATGRESTRWIDFDFFGHQLVVHQVDALRTNDPATNEVEGHAVPASHFGIVMPWESYELLLDQLSDAGMDFVIDHHVRFADRPGEQATFFLKDPCGNYLEFKAFRNIEMLFAEIWRTTRQLWSGQ